MSVLEIEGDRIKLGISAPPDIAIMREELLRHPAPLSSITAIPITPEPQKEGEIEQR